jgi:hypothetical protein
MQARRTSYVLRYAGPVRNFMHPADTFTGALTEGQLVFTALQFSHAYLCLLVTRVGASAMYLVTPPMATQDLQIPVNFHEHLMYAKSRLASLPWQIMLCSNNCYMVMLIKSAGL